MKQLNSLTLDVELRLLSEEHPLINIFLLNVNNYEVYKNVVRERLINFMNNVPITEGIVVFFPSIYRIDDKLNVFFLLQLIELEIIPIAVGSNILGSSIVQQLPKREVVEDHHIWREDGKQSIFYIPF